MANTNIFHNEYSKYPATSIRAKQLGEMYYFTGKKCKKGHLSLRYTSSSNCSQCIAEKKGLVGFNHRGKSSKRDNENQQLALDAVKNGFTYYTSTRSCPKGHYRKFVTTNNCVDCGLENSQERKEKARWARFYKEYGLTKKDFDEMLNNQNHKCSICSCDLDKKNTHIDHCHNKNIVRSLLCNRCNQAIGLLDEKIHNFESAIKYLKRHSNEIT